MSDEPIIRFTLPNTEATTLNPPVMRRKAQGLGRGLGALMGEVRQEEPVLAQSSETPDNSSRGLRQLLVSLIQPHPDQPRRHFDEAALDELAASIAARGVIQPVIVRPAANGTYQLVAGERRWRAAQKAQLHEIPALIRDLDEREVMALALIENIQREDLNPIEEAKAYQRLADSEGLSQNEIARMVDKSRSHIANLQRLLALPDPVIGMVEQGHLSMGHARALIGAENATELAERAIVKKLSVREVEKLIRQSKAPDRKQPQPSPEHTSADSADIAAVQSHLEEFLGLPVRINADADPRSGAVTIRYRTLDQLDLICQRLTGAGI